MMNVAGKLCEWIEDMLPFTFRGFMALLVVGSSIFALGIVTGILILSCMIHTLASR